MTSPTVDCSQSSRTNILQQEVWSQPVPNNLTQDRVQSQPLDLKVTKKPKLSQPTKAPTANAACNTSLTEEEIKSPVSENDIYQTATWKVIKSVDLRYDPVEDYRMKANQRGICLIVNNVLFDMDMFPQRKGSDMDAFRFKEIFKQLGFMIESKRNLPADKMKAVFKQMAARCSSKYDALVVILLSHGTESGIYGTDGFEVDLNDILSCFDNKRCKQMLGKPKVFIVQACRGRMADYGVRGSQALLSQLGSQSLTQSTQYTQPNSYTPRISRWSEIDKDYHPTRTDMVLCFSCHTGFVSTRNEEEGSWLGASLAQHLQKEACRRHLIEIFNMVSRDVRRRKSTDGHKQVLEITTIGFDRNLYFNPGLSADN